MDKECISISLFAAKFEVPERTVRYWCATGKIQGAFLTGKTWNIPSDAVPPLKASALKESPLLKRLREEKDGRIRGGIYHRTQIDLTYNSNHMEGSRLTHDQTRYIFETDTIGVTDEAVRIDDLMETMNHFRCIDYIIDHAFDKPTESMLKELHGMLKNGTTDSRKSWFRVGEYKKLPNEVGGMETCPPEKVHEEMSALLKIYNTQTVKNLEDIINLHCQFERIHPFQDGNGRVGRLLMFKECLANSIVPFIITEELKFYYYRGLKEWGRVNGFLTDTCLSAQDAYKSAMDYFKIGY